MSQIIYTSKPARGPVEHWQGDTFKFRANIKDGNGVAIDATGYRFKMQVRDENDVLIFEILDSEFTKDVSGNILGKKDATVMDKVQCGLYFYDLQSTEISTGDVMTLVYGPLKVVKDITK